MLYVSVYVSYAGRRGCDSSVMNVCCSVNWDKLTMVTGVVSGHAPSVKVPSHCMPACILVVHAHA